MGLRRGLGLLVTVVGAATGIALLLARRIMAAADRLAVHDEPRPDLVKPADEVGPEIEAVVAQLHGAQTSFDNSSRAARREQARRWLDELGAAVEHDCTVVPVSTDACRGDWVVPPDADPSRRLLYVHGGAFEAGSPLSHRGLTTRLAERTGMPVFVVDYGLSPEHTRTEALADVDAAWDLLCREGPDGPTDLAAAFVAGDSAGGNLALGLSLRLRDGAGRRPDAVVAFAPSTDSTFAGPSWRDNVATDPFLGPGFARYLDVPREVLVLAVWARTGIRPDDPRVSPALGDLRDLPPTLVQASDAEMLRDDAVRFVRAAQAAGSPVELQLWPRMVHVFQAFPALPEGQEALDEAVAFLQRHGARATDGVGTS